MFTTPISDVSQRIRVVWSYVGGAISGWLVHYFHGNRENLKYHFPELQPVKVCGPFTGNELAAYLCLGTPWSMAPGILNTAAAFRLMERTPNPGYDRALLNFESRPWAPRSSQSYPASPIRRRDEIVDNSGSNEEHHADSLRPAFEHQADERSRIRQQQQRWCHWITPGFVRPFNVRSFPA